MLGVYLSIETNSLTGRNISLFTVLDLSTPLIHKKLSIMDPMVFIRHLQVTQ